MKIPNLAYLLVLIGVIALSACDQNGDSGYTPPDPGYLHNSQFEIDAQGSMPGWKLIQHASNSSYTYTSQNAVLTLKRTGPEPWGKVRQQFHGDELAPLLGKTLEFSAEIRAEFIEGFGAPQEAPGITVLAKGVRMGASPMLGRVNLVSEKTPLPEAVGSYEWRRYAVTFSLPAEHRTTDLELAILHTMGGLIQVRGPALVEVEPGDQH